jgi:hypothetical protein
MAYSHAAMLAGSNEAIVKLLCDADRRRRNGSLVRGLNDTWHPDGILRDGKAASGSNT